MLLSTKSNIKGYQLTQLDLGKLVNDCICSKQDYTNRIERLCLVDSQKVIP